MTEYVYAIVSPAGEILDYRIQDHPVAAGTQTEYSETKARALPVVDYRPPAVEPWQKVEGPTISIESTQVVYSWTVRDMTESETEAWIEANLIPKIEAEYLRRNGLPIPLEVASDVGVVHMWHTDSLGRSLIGKVVQGILAGVVLTGGANPSLFVPNPRPWKPSDQVNSLNLTHEEFIALDAAIGARDDANFLVQRDLKAAARALKTDPEAAVSLDPIAAWEE